MWFLLETVFKSKAYIELSLKLTVTYSIVNKMVLLKKIAKTIFELSLPLYVWCKIYAELSRANEWP